MANKDDNKIDSNEDIKFKTWKESTNSLLGTIDNYCFQPFSISVVPDELRKWNENAYIPKVVSIGPRYKGATRDLQQMEEIKWRYMQTLFLRAEHEKDISVPEKCMKAILRLDGAVRASYVDEIKLDRYELATIMLFDGCFLLELLISGSKQLSEKLKSTGAGLENRSVGRQEEAFADLTLMENQLPLLILNELAQQLFPKVFEYNKDGICTIESLVLSLLGFSPVPSFITLKAGHLLELTYTSNFEKLLLIQMEQESRDHLDGDYLEHESIIDVEPGDIKRDQIKLNRCATRILAAGITIKPPHTNKDEVKKNPRISFNFEIEFNKAEGILEIPPLHITKTSEAVWRNFIAWEHHKMKAKRIDINNRLQSGDENSASNKFKCSDWGASLFKCCLSKDRNVDRSQSHTGQVTSASGYKCKCTWAALLFSGLICCASDVELLKSKKVLVNHTKMKNRDLVNFFHSITNGVDTSIVDPDLCNVFTKLDTYRATSYVKKIIVIFWHYFTRILEPFYSLHRYLSKGYNYVAAITVFLTLIQTVYTLVAYHHPPKNSG